MGHHYGKILAPFLDGNCTNSNLNLFGIVRCMLFMNLYTPISIRSIAGRIGMNINRPNLFGEHAKI